MSSKAKPLSAQIDIFWSHDRVGFIWKIHFPWKKIQKVCYFWLFHIRNLHFIASSQADTISSTYSPIVHSISICWISTILGTERSFVSKPDKSLPSHCGAGDTTYTNRYDVKYIYIYFIYTMWKTEQDKEIDIVGARAILYGEFLSVQIAFEWRSEQTSGVFWKESQQNLLVDGGGGEQGK